MTTRTQLVVLYHDHQHMYFPVGPDCGWRIDNASRCLVVGTFPRTYIPLDTVRSFDIEAIGGGATDEFDPPKTALERLHTTVVQEMASAETQAKKARDADKLGETEEFSARVDALDWVLQRIDEEAAR